MREAESHFESMEQQAHAARLGMWLFLASELLLFAGLFALYAAYRAHDPIGFANDVAHNTKTLGSINTGVLLVSSYFAASAVHDVREGKLRRAGGFVIATIALGAVFLTLKMIEYAHHFHEGIYPGHGTFWTLYYVTTGLHAVHVTIGMGVLTSTLLGMKHKKITQDAPQRMEIAVIYWHLIDVIWIFVWPLYYLANRP
jgi:cytochrome c oxidase subunit 3